MAIIRRSHQPQRRLTKAEAGVLAREILDDARDALRAERKFLPRNPIHSHRPPLLSSPHRHRAVFLNGVAEMIIIITVLLVCLLGWFVHVVTG